MTEQLLPRVYFSRHFALWRPKPLEYLSQLLREKCSVTFFLFVNEKPCNQSKDFSFGLLFCEPWCRIRNSSCMYFSWNLSYQHNIPVSVFTCSQCSHKWSNYRYKHLTTVYYSCIWGFTYFLACKYQAIFYHKWTSFIL